MADPVSNPELLRSLGRLVRGLSALFWGLPMALIICTGTASGGWFSTFGELGFLPASAATGLLLFGLWELGAFQNQERPWRNALDRARLLALVNFMLSPFLFWWSRVPEQTFFLVAVSMLVFFGLVFLFDLNFVLQRLGAMLPDETLRLEIRQYTRFNRSLLIVLLALTGTYLILSRTIQSHFSGLPDFPDLTNVLSLHIAIPSLGIELRGFWLVWLVICVLVLLPLSMTMALIWKTKEVVLEGVFAAK